jgi:hypothetical protein
MGKINMARVILGGIVAGFVMNIGEFLLNGKILAGDWESAMRSLNRTSLTGNQILWFVAMTFVLGIMTIWLYAAIRPRFGPGPKTAICAGLVVWFFVCLYSSVGYWVMDLFPSRILTLGTLWGIFEFPIGALVGAWLYKED